MSSSKQNVSSCTQKTSVERAKVKQKKDNETIHQLQTDYIFLRMWNAHENSSTEKDLVKALQNLAKKFIFYEREKNHFFISSEDVEIKSLEAAAYIMIQFKKRPDFRLKTPSQYVRLRVLHELYYHKKMEKKLVYTDQQLEYYVEGTKRPHGDLTTHNQIFENGNDY